MIKEPGNTDRQVKKTAALYNMLINVFWTVTCLAPLYYYCDQYVRPDWLFAISGISLLAILLPRSVLIKTQLSKSSSLYEQLGIARVNYLAQNGGLVNGLIRKKIPAYRLVTHSQRQILKTYNSTFMYERFHYLVMIFFLGMILHAVRRHSTNWFLLLSVLNIVYNIYPILLQQYVRVRLGPLLLRFSAKSG